MCGRVDQTLARRVFRLN